MITKEQFLNLIEEYLRFNVELEQLNDGYHIDLSECNLIKFGQDMFDFIIDQSFNENAVEDINWWLFERDYKYKGPQMWKLKKDGTKEEIPTNTSDDFWNLIKDNRK